MIRKEIENEATTHNIEIDLELRVENQEAEKTSTPKKDTKKKQARKNLFNFQQRRTFS
jgi:hypothetical protein